MTPDDDSWNDLGELEEDPKWAALSDDYELDHEPAQVADVTACLPEALKKIHASGHPIFYSGEVVTIEQGLVSHHPRAAFLYEQIHVRELTPRMILDRHVKDGVRAHHLRCRHLVRWDPFLDYAFCPNCKCAVSPEDVFWQRDPGLKRRVVRPRKRKRS